MAWQMGRIPLPARIRRRGAPAGERDQGLRRPKARSRGESAVFLAGDGNGAEIVEAHQTAGFVRAAGKRDLEFAAERLRIGMAEHEVRVAFA